MARRIESLLMTETSTAAETRTKMLASVEIGLYWGEPRGGEI
jgi:hypothetical protein